ncbi:unnamed protein product, partial [Meganyctiphanes norvegica]
ENDINCLSFATSCVCCKGGIQQVDKNSRGGISNGEIVKNGSLIDVGISSELNQGCLDTDTSDYTSAAFHEAEQICTNKNGHCVPMKDCPVGQIDESDINCLSFATSCVCCKGGIQQVEQIHRGGISNGESVNNGNLIGVGILNGTNQGCIATDAANNTSAAFNEAVKICANKNGICVPRTNCPVGHIDENDINCLSFATSCVCCKGKL